MTIERLRASLTDRYRIERELGAGGMATVYLAHDLKHDRQVAVKVLRPDLAAALGPERFLREIHIAAQLQHPHILPMHDSGEAEGFLYYVMPYVEGESLRARLTRQGELPVHESVKLLVEIVDALSYAHARGVVHRDMKPDNVMLSGRHALVMDFGVAKAVSEASGRNTLTTAGVALGTPAYMAPEQAAADPHLDHRVDIYAVGVMAYELLSGRTPFTGGTPQQVLAAQVTEIPDPLSKHRPGVSAALEQVVMRCLAKRPADRWQSAEELLVQLEPLVTPSGGVTPTQTRPVEAVQAKRSNTSAWVGRGALVAVLAVATTSLLAHHRTPVAAALRDRVQLTSTGRVSLPAISPDGKEPAYVVTDCGGGTCRYGIELQDVGATGARRLLDGVTALYDIRWSPDRRTLLFTGTVAGRFGTYLVSVLGGAPRLVTFGYGTFGAGSDSLLATAQFAPDSVFWVRVSGLDGVAGDSIRVTGPAQQMIVVGAVPDSHWLIV